MADRRFVALDGGPPNDGRPPSRTSSTSNPNIRYTTRSGNPPNGGRPPGQPPSQPPQSPIIRYHTRSGDPPFNGLPPSAFAPAPVPIQGSWVTQPLPPPPPPPPPAPPVIIYHEVSSRTPSPVRAWPTSTPTTTNEYCSIRFYEFFRDKPQPWQPGGSTRSSSLDYTYPANSTTVREVLHALGCRGETEGLAEAEFVTVDREGKAIFKKGRVWTKNGEGSRKTLKEAGWRVHVGIQPAEGDAMRMGMHVDEP